MFHSCDLDGFESYRLELKSKPIFFVFFFLFVADLCLSWDAWSSFMQSCLCVVYYGFPWSTSGHHLHYGEMEGEEEGGRASSSCVHVIQWGSLVPRLPSFFGSRKPWEMAAE